MNLPFNIAPDIRFSVKYCCYPLRKRLRNDSVASYMLIIGYPLRKRLRNFAGAEFIRKRCYPLRKRLRNLNP